MRGWQSPVVALDPNHAPIADLPMIRLDSLGIEPAIYRVNGKKRRSSNKSENVRSSNWSQKFPIDILLQYLQLVNWLQKSAFS